MTARIGYTLAGSSHAGQAVVPTISRPLWLVPATVIVGGLLCAVGCAGALQEVSTGAPSASEPGGTTRASEPAADTGPWTAFCALLDDWAPELRGHLAPPASESAIARAEEELEAKLPADIAAIYRVHNGFIDLPERQSAPLLSLEEALRVRRAMLDRVERYPEDGIRWEKSWLPVFDYRSGDYLFVDVLSPIPSPIMEHNHETRTQEQEHASLASYLRDYNRDHLNELGQTLARGD